MKATLKARLEAVERKRGAAHSLPDAFYWDGYVLFPKTGAELWDDDARRWVAENEKGDI
jgi:hypothetical protein